MEEKMQSKFMEENKKCSSLSVIIPCYNEEKNIAECVKRIPVMQWKTEIIAIDDGSKDNTLKEMKKIVKKNFRFYSYKKNQGKGFAVSHAIEKTENDVIVIQDCDMSTMPEEIPLIVKPIFEGNTDFVNTSRLNEKIKPKAMSRIHFIGNKFFASLVSFLTGIHFSDTLSGSKAFKRKDFLNELKEKGWMDFELIFLAKKKKLRILEIPVKYKKRVKGETKMKIFPHSVKMFYSIIKNFLKMKLTKNSFN